MAGTLMDGVYKGYGKPLDSIAYNTPDARMLANLQRNVYHFSAAKNYQMLKAMTEALAEGDRIRSFPEFRREAAKVANEFVGNWMRTEYDTAIGSAQMAGKWVSFEADKAATPFLQYSTVGDDRVRESHKALDGVVKEVDDAFWNTYYPPNGWNCRCTVVALPGKAKPTPDDRITAPDVPPMFQTNLAKSGLVFPKNHPYFKGVPKKILTSLEDPAKTALPNYLFHADTQSRIDFSMGPDAHEFLKQRGFTDADAWNLSGGIPVQAPTEASYTAKLISKSTIEVNGKCKEYDLQRRIDFGKKEIYNAFMEAGSKGGGIGTSLFVNQVKAAREQGFKKLTVYAFGGDGIGGDWTGYYRWARLGYTMDKPDQERFKRWAQIHGRKEKTVNELVKTEDGFDYWKKNGFKWHGTFRLNDNSRNMRLLEKYLKEKKIDFKL